MLSREQLAATAASLFASFRGTGHPVQVCLDQAIDAAIILHQKVDERYDGARRPTEPVSGHPLLTSVATAPAARTEAMAAYPPGSLPTDIFPRSLRPEHMIPGVAPLPHPAPVVAGPQAQVSPPPIPPPNSDHANTMPQQG